MAILNSDDRWHPLRIEQLVDHFRGPAAPDAVFSRVRLFDQHGNVSSKNPWYEGGIAHFKEGRPLWLSLFYRNFLMTTSNIIARRATMLELHGFRPFRYCHDLDFAMRALLAGKSIQFVEESLCDYRFHEGNTIRENLNLVLLDEAIIAAETLLAYHNELAKSDLVGFCNEIIKKSIAPLVLTLVEMRHELLSDFHYLSFYESGRHLLAFERSRKYVREGGWDASQFLGLFRVLLSAAESDGAISSRQGPKLAIPAYGEWTVG